MADIDFMPTLRETSDGIKARQPQTLLDQAKAQYPYLKDANVSFTHTPDPAEDRQLEYWAPHDAGWEWKGQHYTRPSELPVDTHGIQVFSDKVRPIDILGDYVSHSAVNSDPKLKELYQQFAQSLKPDVMEDRYRYHRDQLGETRPYEEWYKATGLPEMFRGYTFDQWPGATAMYTPEQLKILDAVKSHVGLEVPGSMMPEGFTQIPPPSLVK